MTVNADEFEKFLMYDDGLAAQQHLAAGRPIYFGDEKYPSGIVRKYPDGRLQLVSINERNEIVVIKNLSSQEAKSQ